MRICFSFKKVSNCFSITQQQDQGTQRKSWASCNQQKWGEIDLMKFHSALPKKHKKDFIRKKRGTEKPRELFTPAPRCYLGQSCLSSGPNIATFFCPPLASWCHHSLLSQLPHFPSLLIPLHPLTLFHLHLASPPSLPRHGGSRRRS